MPSRLLLLLVAGLSLVACGQEGAETGGADLDAVVDGCTADTVDNGDFETGALTPWTRARRVAVVKARKHAGSFSARLGGQVASPGHNRLDQIVHIPAAADGASSLSFWFEPHCAAAPDRNTVELRVPGGPRLALLMKACTTSASFTQRTFDLSSWAGQDVLLRFDTYDDGAAATPSFMYVDDVQVITEVAAPGVAITSPADGAVVNGTVTVTAAATTSACTALDRVELYADGALLSSGTTSPASAPWNAGAAAPGSHTLTARVFDALGGTAEHSIQVTRPCGDSSDWTIPIAASSAVDPVTAASGPNGIDDVGNPRLSVFLPTALSLHAYDARLATDQGTATVAGAIARPPVVAELNGNTFLFLASADGHLHRMQMSGGVMVAAGSVDLRRPSCSADALVATPILVKKVEAGPGYALPDDALFVITHHACGDFSQNQVLAWDLAQGINAPPIWVFNEFGEYQMDRSAGGCAVDLAANRLYCATNLEPGRLQDTIWAIDINTGALAWAKNVGALRGKPALNPVSRHLFVANTTATLFALDPDDATEPGHADWTLQVNTSSGVGVVTDVWAESRAPLNDLVFAADTAGVMHAVVDVGGLPGDGVLAWSTSPGGADLFTGAPVLSAGGKLYAGTNRGRLLQIEPTAGGIEATRSIAPAAGNLTSGALLLPGGVVVTSQSGASGTITKRFCAPFVFGSNGS